MKLYMKQKLFSWTDKFSIVDEHGNAQYYVEGELLSWGKKLHLYNSGGRELAFIRQKMMSWLPRYFVEIDGEVLATVVKEFTFLRPSYHIEGLSWQMQGDFASHNYTMYAGQHKIMQLSKAWFTWGDSYELEIFDPDNAVLCLSVALAVDCALAQAQDNP